MKPKPQSRTGRNFKQTHWTIESAANEFGRNRDTLIRALKENGIEPCFTDKTFSTMQICRALFPAGDKKDAEQTRLITEQADTVAIKKAKLLKELVPIVDVERIWSGVMLELRNKISYAKIPDAVKSELSRDLQAVSVEEYFKEAKEETTEEN